MTTSPPVGLIGLGLLGSAISERLLGARFAVLGFDIDVERREALALLGGRVANDAADVARQSQRVILSLPTSVIAATVVDEIAAQLAPGAIVIDTTTGEPAEMARIGEQLESRGVRYLDATVAGSSEQARHGEVLVLVGGESKTVAACQDLFDAFARRTIHVGPCGSGARMKLVVNLVLGLNRAVLAEGLSFARACGIDPRAALDVLRDSPAYSTVMDTKGEKMLTGDFTPEARLRQHLKDVRLILAAAAEHGAKTPLSAWHAAALQALVDQGFGDDDNASVIRAFE
ncbi:MAG: NAD(P)-dependent oxidoreductase [Planctomycetaceae bacterium]